MPASDECERATPTFEKVVEGRRARGEFDQILLFLKLDHRLRENRASTRVARAHRVSRAVARLAAARAARAAHRAEALVRGGELLRDILQLLGLLDLLHMLLLLLRLLMRMLVLHPRKELLLVLDIIRIVHP